MMARTDMISDFIAQNGWQDATRVSVAGDASNRRYERLTKADGASIILMDAPAERGEDVRPFVRIAEYLSNLGLSAPKIYAQNTDAGLLLIEDLGDDLFARVLERDPSLEVPLYAAATDVLVALHRAPMPKLDAYDTKELLEKAGLAFDWYLTGAAGAECSDQKSRFIEVFQPHCDALSKTPAVLIQRDYHAENLLWLPDRNGVACVGLLDFQDAMAGHPSYDLVSMLQDARRDVTPAVEQEMIARYLASQPQNESDFRKDYAVMGVQRNLRILGVFARLCIRDAKPAYLDYIPRVWALLQRNLSHPALTETASLLDAELPPPIPETIERIRRQCGTHQNP